MVFPDYGKRREVRFPLHLPVNVVGENVPQQISARSENISLRGILFSAGSAILHGSSVTVFVAVPGMGTRSPFGLASTGKVVRVSRQQSGSFAVAVACDHPFQMVTIELA
jgi:hypothetical protein